MKPRVSIWSDGGVREGVGAYAAIIDSGEINRLRIVSGKMPLHQLTVQYMELRAVVEGLKAIISPSRVTIYSDSRYVVDAGRKKASRASCWYLWAEYQTIAWGHDVNFIWVRGHSGMPYNERAHMEVRRLLFQGAEESNVIHRPDNTG